MSLTLRDLFYWSKQVNELESDVYVTLRRVLVDLGARAASHFELLLVHGHL